MRSSKLQTKPQDVRAEENDPLQRKDRVLIMTALYRCETVVEVELRIPLPVELRCATELIGLLELPLGIEGFDRFRGVAPKACPLGQGRRTGQKQPRSGQGEAPGVNLHH